MWQSRLAVKALKLKPSDLIAYQPLLALMSSAHHTVTVGHHKT